MIYELYDQSGAMRSHLRRRTQKRILSGIEQPTLQRFVARQWPPSRLLCCCRGRDLAHGLPESPMCPVSFLSCFHENHWTLRPLRIGMVLVGKRLRYTLQQHFFLPFPAESLLRCL
jgi:hypothetical protein